MRENETRPDELYDETMRLHNIDTEKILLKSKSFVKVYCPACNKVEYELFYKRDGFTFVKCSVCETVFVNPRPTKETIKKTIDCCIKAKIYPSVGYLLPQPGSWAFDYAVKKDVKRGTPLSWGLMIR